MLSGIFPTFAIQYPVSAVRILKIFSNFVALSNRQLHIESIYEHPWQKMW